jgi:hypothetical protein
VKRALLAITLVLAAAPAWPLDPVTIELHHRSAESLLSVLRPLAAPATLAGSGTQLQVRAAPTDVARVTRLIGQADRPLRPLAFALRDQPPPGEPDPPGGDRSVTLATGRAMPADSYGNGQMLSTSPQNANELLEGDPLLISIPAAQSIWFRGGGAGAGPKSASSSPDVAGVVHFDAVSDFTARIWLNGETVAIDLEPRAAGRLSAGSDPNFEGATVYGRLGQWIALGGSATSRDWTATGSGAPGTGLWIKVRARGP